MRRSPEAGALEMWHQQLREGRRTRLTADLLWLAAVHEAQARDYERNGAATAAEEARRHAARLALEHALTRSAA
jgi:hypothetical protein